MALVLSVLVAVNLYVFLWRGGTSIPEIMERAALAGEPGSASRVQESVDSNGVLDPDFLFDPGRWVEGQVRSGDSVGEILRRSGANPRSSDRLIRGLKDAMDLRQIRPGQQFRLWLSKAGEVRAFEFRVSRIETLVLTKGAEGAFEVERARRKTEKKIEAVGGTISSSLAGELSSGALVALFVDAFAYDLNFYVDQHKGDTFKMLVEAEYLDGELLQYHDVVAAEYTGREGVFRSIRWQPPGEATARYFDEKGRAVERMFLKTPLKYARISSKFNPNRMHPVLHQERGHWGVDYAAPTGTPVWAAASGKIVHRGPKGGGGNVVIIKHDGGYETSYLHLSRFAKGHKVGQTVTQKTVIGYVGATGLATGPHLHYSVKKHGKHIDPLTMEMERRPGVPRLHLAEFQQHFASVAEQLNAVNPAL